MSSIRALRHLRRIITDIQMVLAHSRHDWIIFLEAGEIELDEADFEIWVYPDKLIATEENAAKLRRFLAPLFRFTGLWHQMRLRE